MNMDADEWLIVAGAAFVAARIGFGFALLARGYWTATPAAPIGVGKMGVAPFIVAPIFTALGCGAIGLGLASLLSDGPRPDHRSLVYGFSAAGGIVFGMIFELLFTIRLYKFSMWLSQFRAPRLREQLQSGDPAVRLQAAKGLSRLGAHSRVAWNELLAALRDESAEVRTACARTLLYMHFEKRPAEDLDAAAAIRSALTDPDFRVRTAAAGTLIQFHAISPTDALPPLVEGLTQGDDETVISAMRGLSLLGVDAAPAGPALRDQILRPREDLSSHLPYLESNFEIFLKMGAAAVPLLMEILEGGNLDAKNCALGTLGKLGEPAREAIPAIRKIAGRPSRIRDTAKRALRRLGAS